MAFAPSLDFVFVPSKASMALSRPTWSLASSPSRLTKLKVDSYTGAVATLSWTPAVESGVTSYIVAYGPAADPLRHRVSVTQAHATLPQIAPGTIVSVKAVNTHGLEGWDWARTTVGEPRATRMTP